MDDHDYEIDLWKEVTATPEEEKKLKEEAYFFVNELKTKRVCLSAKKANPRFAQTSFRDCLGFVEDCDILLCEAPFCTLGAIYQEFDEIAQALARGHKCVTGGVQITKTEQAPHTVYVTPFFPEVDTKWNSEPVAHDFERGKWIHVAEVEFCLSPSTRNLKRRKIRVFHMGLGGDAMWAFLLAPHRIQPKIIVGISID